MNLIGSGLQHYVDLSANTAPERSVVGMRQHLELLDRIDRGIGAEGVELGVDECIPPSCEAQILESKTFGTPQCYNNA